MITIARDVLYRALHTAADFACEDPTREHLAGVLLEVSDQVHVVATDGHTLVAGHLAARAGGKGSALIPSEHVAVLVKLLKPIKANAHHGLEVILGQRTVRINGLGIVDFEVPCREKRDFPPWRKVVPDPTERKPGEGAGAFALDPLYIERAGRAARRFGQRLGIRAGVRH